jgi:NADH:ubiquinone oxidoreductase subunit 3 (subunit A)
LIIKKFIIEHHTPYKNYCCICYCITFVMGAILGKSARDKCKLAYKTIKIYKIKLYKFYNANIHNKSINNKKFIFKFHLIIVKFFNFQNDINNLFQTKIGWKRIKVSPFTPCPSKVTKWKCKKILIYSNVCLKCNGKNIKKF